MASLDNDEDIWKSLGVTARPGGATSEDVRTSDNRQTSADATGAKKYQQDASEEIWKSLGVTARPGTSPEIGEKPITGTVRVPSGGDFASSIISGMPIVGPLLDRATAATDIAGTEGANQQYAKDNPIKSTIGNLIGGGLVTMPLAGTGLGAAALGLRGSTLGARVYSGLAGGAAIGGTDAALRGENPLTGAGVGGVLGAAGPLAGHAIGNIVEGLSNTLRRAPAALANVNTIGRGWLANALTNETDASIQAARDRVGPQGFLADINPATTELAAGIANRPEPPASSAVGEAYRIRDAGQRATINTALDNAFGPRANIEQFRDMITENRSEVSDPLYRQWRSMEVPSTPALERLTPRLRNVGAFEEAEFLSHATGRPLNHNFPEGETPTPETWDLVKRGLDSQIERAFTAGNRTRATALIGLRNELITEIGRTPAGQVWNQARRAFAERSQLLDQVAAGQDTFLGSRSGLTVDQLRHELQGLSQPELAARIMGARSAADEVMGATANGDTTLRNKFLAPNNQEKLRLLIGRNQAQALHDTLEQQQYLSGQARYVNPRAGSPTAPRNAAINALEAPPLPEWNPNLTQPLSFIPPSWVDALRPSTIIEGGRRAAYANARQQVVPALLSQGDQMNALLQAIRQESGSRAAAAQRGSRAGTAITAAITGPGSSAARRRGKFSTNALVGGAQ